MKLKHPDIRIPENMKSLPISDRGYLKPWFVKADDFRVVDSEKAEIANSKKACWICGQPFTVNRYALVCSPLSAMTKVFREPPSHIECAEYAMRVCPFILYPHSKRRTANLEVEATLDYINRDLEIKQAEENPGEYYLVIVKDFYKDIRTKTIRCAECDVIERQHWKGGSKMSGHPVPIVTHEKLPQDMRDRLTVEQFHQSFGQVGRPSEPPVFEIIRADKHQKLNWVAPIDYEFASRDTVVPIGAKELTKAMHSVPTGFIKQDQAYKLVAILGSEPARNMFVSTDFKWKERYIPTLFHCYPFRLGRNQDGGHIVCVSSSSVIENADGNFDRAHRFFDNEGRLGPTLEKIAKSLEQAASDIEFADQLVAQIERLSVIKPWPSTEGENTLGLYCIDEAALDGLPAEELVNIRDTGALLFAYCQLLSMGHIQKLA